MFLVSMFMKSPISYGGKTLMKRKNKLEKNLDHFNLVEIRNQVLI